MSIKVLLDHLAELGKEHEEKGGEAEGDFIAVLRMAVQMADKMKISRAKGRGGWGDPARLPISELTVSLFHHLPKGDLVDVMNFCAMVHLRGLAEGYDQEAYKSLLSTYAKAWAQEVCQEHYDFMEQVYKDTETQLRKEQSEAWTGEIQIDDPLSLQTLQRAEKYMAKYLRTVLGALLPGLPHGMVLICQIDNFRSDQDNKGMEIHMHICDKTQVRG